MILKSFLLGNPVSLCMKIINSVVVVGLYYGFLTTFSIGPSYLFLLRAWVMEEEEGTEKLVSATTGFIMGQLMMFISIYYAPLHLALDRPHTITVLVLPYLLFHFLWEIEIQCFEYNNRNRNSIRNFSVRRVFLNNLIFQIVNQFLLPSSTLARLVNVSMFRCNNKMLFVTSSFVGWLIGHILFMKWVGLVLFWIRKMNSIGISTNKYILFCKHYASGLFLRSKDQLFVIILLITNIFYLGRIPSLALTRRVSESLERKRWEKRQKQMQREREIRGQRAKIGKKHFVSRRFEGHIVNLLFDYKQWNRPLRYIKNDNFEKPVIDEMSQYFFRTRLGYGEQIISLTYPPSLSTFWKMMQRKLKYWPRERKRERPWDFYFDWLSINQQKKRRMRRELVDRIRALSKGALVLDVLEKRTRLCECDDENNQNYYLPKALDPFLSGPYRRKRPKEGFEISTRTKENWISSIICSILIVDFPELFDPKNKELAYRVILRNTIISEVVDQRRQAILAKSRKIGKKTISTKVPRWSNELGIDFQEEEVVFADDPTEYYPVLLRPYDRVVVYTEDDPEPDTNLRTDINRDPEDQLANEMAILQYTKETDVYRDLIMGSTLAQRRKAAIFGPYQTSVRSPLFLDRTERTLFPSFGISNTISNIISNIKRAKNVFSFWVGKGPKFEVSTSDSKIKKDKEPTETRYLSREEEEIQNFSENEASEKAIERVQELFAEIIQTGAWEVVLALQGSRGLALLAQSYFRKNILLPSMVIAKNLVRMLFFLTPEWSADWRDWEREMHIKCTYTGVEISDTEFPNDWLVNGIQIKVLFPFYPKLWRRSELRSRHRDPMKEKKRNTDWERKKRKLKYNRSFYLTALGGAVARPLGRSVKIPCFFTPIWKELKRRIRKDQNKPFSVLIRGPIRALIKGFPFLRTILGILKDKTRWIQKITPFIRKKKIKEFEKKNPIFRKPNREIKKRVSHSQIQMRKMYIKRRRIGGEIKKLQEELLDLLPTPDGNISETGLDAEKLEIRLSIWEILSGIGARLKHKLRLIIKYLFIERIYMDIFLCTINISRIHAQLLFESKIIKYIENIQKRIEEKKKRKATIDFFSDFKKSHSNISNEKSQTSRYLSSLSQVHVFYNLSQTQAININKYRSMSVLQDRGAHLFLRDRTKDHLRTLEMLDVKSSPISFKAFLKAFKDRIKDFLRTLGILGAKSSPKRLTNFDKWKNWLIRGHYQYNLSQTRWSRLVSQKGRNEVSKRRTSQNKKSKKDSYKKGRPIHREKQKNYVMNSPTKLQKNYRYDLLSQKYIHCGDEKEPYLSISVKNYTSLRDNLSFSDYRCFNDFLEKKTRDFIRENISGFLNEKLKEKINDPHLIGTTVYIIGENENVSIVEKYIDDFIEKKMNDFIDENLSNFLQEKISDLLKENISDRDLLEKKIRDFIEIEEEEIEEGSIMNGDGDTWGRKYFEWEIVHNLTSIKTQTEEAGQKATMLPLAETPSEPPLEKLLEKAKKRIKTKTKMDFQVYWFLPELAQPYVETRYNDAYEPWIIPNKSIVFDYEVLNEEQQESIRKKEREKERKKEREKKREKERKKKYIKEFMKKYSRKLKQYRFRSKILQARIKSFLKKHLLYQIYLTPQMDIWGLREVCFMLRMNLDSADEFAVYVLRLNDAFWVLSRRVEYSMRRFQVAREFLKAGVMFVDPIRLFRKLDGPSIMYQTISISLVHKNQHQTNQRCREKKYELLVPDNIPSTRRRREFRIRVCLDSVIWIPGESDPVLVDEYNTRNCVYFLDEDKHIDTDRKNLIRFKLFLWPNYRLEDLACMNRYWFDIDNGSRFSMSRIHMYPRFRIS
uniref:hypothetical chloroplast RF1 n=1 Tax=Sphaerocoryne affinis TaxID=1636236 RepID=UPI0022FDAB29|nr:hypothetical chloroplast RF1 [Sphaerocoryne affinis]YP_010623531.1 hypothetical chloroplast RF1 [Sphaerocoryne affinis]WBF97568.1 hypothetical chloroplast RF1 [Sphaerocoryne affinis]WBF97589.1 hypothetical chloroplast RF1 [Sphaerocoryne affinis]